MNAFTVMRDPGLPVDVALAFAEDIRFGFDGVLPDGVVSQGDDPDELEVRMRRLLDTFASQDDSGMATRLFDAFLAARDSTRVWVDGDYSRAVAAHENIQGFQELVLNAPGHGLNSDNPRIHQGLAAVNWDISRMETVTGVQTPALNLGEDLRNGLKVMVNDITHVIVVANDYHFDLSKCEYSVELDYYFYDVFGLDDDDAVEFGANGGIDLGPRRGIAAWWQLQRQHGYAPLVTRAKVSREFTVEVADELCD